MIFKQKRAERGAVRNADGRTIGQLRSDRFCERAAIVSSTGASGPRGAAAHRAPRAPDPFLCPPFCGWP